MLAPDDYGRTVDTDRRVIGWNLAADMVAGHGPTGEAFDPCGRIDAATAGG